MRTLLICCLLAPLLTRADVELVDTRTPWRAYLVQGMNILRDKGTLKIAVIKAPAPFDPANLDPARHRFSPFPSAEWTESDFDDGAWARYLPEDLADFMGDYGAVIDGKSWPAALLLRTRFGVVDPARARDVKLSVTYIGGAVVYVNGREIGRAHLSEGKLHLLSPAEDYPVQAYTQEDGKPLPTIDYGAKHATPLDPALASRYDHRLRTCTMTIPSDALTKGGNVITVELHRAPVNGPMPNKAWSHLGINKIRLSSASGEGVIAYEKALAGTRAWNASPVEQITADAPAQSLIKRSWFWAMYWTRGMPVKGVQFGNPFEPLRPIRMLGARNGVASGQVVVSHVDGLRDLEATIGDLKGPVVITSGAVQIRYAAQQEGLHYCDALLPEPIKGAKTIPVWVIVNVPQGAAPGWYVSTLSLRGNGKSFQVPVQLQVSPILMPAAKELESHIGMTHSPETLAMHYKVAPFSDAHWRLIGRSMELLGQLGNDVIHIPVVHGGGQPTAKGLPRATTNPAQIRAPLVRFVKEGDRLKPEFSLLERYLDEYQKHCAPPRALNLHIWEAACVPELADAYENRRIASRIFTPKAPLTVTQLNPASGETSIVSVPAITDEGAEAFYKPLLDGVRDIVMKRGWSERIIMLALGGDFRPGEKSGQLMRQWAPYARWNLLSHFSGDPGPSGGKMIATGNLEVGLKEWPAGSCLPAIRLEERLLTPPDFLELPTIRWQHQEYSPPMLFRTLVMQWGDVTRLGLDFWLAKQKGPTSVSFFSHVNALTVPGPDGAIPTVRFQMLREGAQDAQVRAMIIRAYAKLSEEQRKPYRALLDEFVTRCAWSNNYLSQHELSWDWPGYIAKMHEAAAQLQGAALPATWNQPPQ